MWFKKLFMKLMVWSLRKWSHRGKKKKKEIFYWGKDEINVN